MLPGEPSCTLGSLDRRFQAKEHAEGRVSHLLPLNSRGLPCNFPSSPALFEEGWAQGTENCAPRPPVNWVGFLYGVRVHGRRACHGASYSLSLQPNRELEKHRCHQPLELTVLEPEIGVGWLGENHLIWERMVPRTLKSIAPSWGAVMSAPSY